jgi:PEGA domain
MSSRIIVATLTAFICVWGALDALNVHAQQEGGTPGVAPPLMAAAPGIPLSASQPIWRAQDAIYKAHPHIESVTIERDKAALGKAYQVVWTQTGKSQLSDANAGKLLATVWTDYRVGNPGSKTDFDEAKVVALANRYGGLHVTTSPARATVWVDDKQWDGVTELTGYTTAGRRKIRVGGLKGYQDDEAEVEVVATTITEFNRKLRRK